MYVCIESTKPTMAEIHRHVRDEIAYKWFDLGILLKVPDHQLDIIYMNHCYNTQFCCTEMFSYWLKTDTEASWRKLIIALRNMAQNSLADKIKTQILLGMYYVCEQLCIIKVCS